MSGVPGSITAASVFGLPSLRVLDEGFAGVPGAGLPGAGVRVWLCVGPTDMRRGFDRLAQQAEQVTGEDPLSGHLFVFRNRRGDKLKVLLWDRDGYVLIYKRLEEGVFKLPRVSPDQMSVNLEPSELAMLLDGIDLSSVKRGKRYRRRRK